MAKVAPHDSPAVYDRHLRVSLPASSATQPAGLTTTSTVSLDSTTCDP
jgi:hypothetical protein